MRLADAPIHRVAARAPAAADTESASKASSTRLRGRWLLLARAGWLAVALYTVVLFVASLVIVSSFLRQPCPADPCTTGRVGPAELRALHALGLSLDFFAGYFVALLSVFAGVYAAVAVMIFWRRADDRVALFSSITLLTFGAASFPGVIGILATVSPGWLLPVKALEFLSSIAFNLFLFIFPDGRFVPRWTRWVFVVWGIQQAFHHFFPRSPFDTNSWPVSLQFLVWAVFLGCVIYAQLYRYRRVSTPTQRQQTKWVVLGIAGAFVGFLGSQIMLLLMARTLTTPDAWRTYFFVVSAYYLAMLLIPLSIAVALLRYHLFDVDVWLSRALVYGALTVSVLVLYVSIVAGAGLVFQVQGNPLVSLLAAGVVAVVFQPLRERLQRGVNTLLYGQRDEPYAVLSRLGQRLEATLEPAAVLPVLAETVAQAVKLPYVAVTLKHDGGFPIVATHGVARETTLTVPLIYRGEILGHLLLAPRAPGEAFSPADKRLLDDLARQAGVAAHAILLTNELQRARERLVLAREEERRRLRRDLHDGLGPQLASQALTLTAATKLLRRDPAAAEALLSDATGHAQAAINDIRRVVYALRPPALDDLGLVAALREQATHYFASGLHIIIDAPDSLPPLPAAVEVAAYRIAQEALTNVVKHAKARVCTVRLRVEGCEGARTGAGTSALSLEVRDDGRGLAASEANAMSVGLTSMRERAAELGGSCVVESVPGGVCVSARLPLP